MRLEDYTEATTDAELGSDAPSSAKHTWHDDGTVTVVYSDGRAILYPSPRDASIESSLIMFPGTSREWLERMHDRG